VGKRGSFGELCEKRKGVLIGNRLSVKFRRHGGEVGRGRWVKKKDKMD